jgi:hypothetical protein
VGRESTLSEKEKHRFQRHKVVGEQIDKVAGGKVVGEQKDKVGGKQECPLYLR